MRRPWMSFLHRLRTRSCCLASSRSKVDCSRLRMAYGRRRRERQRVRKRHVRKSETHLAQRLGVLCGDDDAGHERRSSALAKLEADLRAGASSSARARQRRVSERGRTMASA